MAMRGLAADEGRKNDERAHRSIRGDGPQAIGGTGHQHAMAPGHAPRCSGASVTNACFVGTRLPRSMNRVRVDAGNGRGGPRWSPVAAVFGCNRRGETAMAGERPSREKGWDKPWTVLFSLSVS